MDPDEYVTISPHVLVHFDQIRFILCLPIKSIAPGVKFDRPNSTRLDFS